MARSRVNSEATVNHSLKDVAKLHSVAQKRVIDWGNGYAILDVEVEVIVDVDQDPAEVAEAIVDALEPADEATEDE